jgi:GT2 family glycosyltransferase
MGLTQTVGLAVVIPSWNTADYIGDCVASVRAETDVDHDLVVVDNGSTDQSLERLHELKLSPISLPENVGFAKAVNLGALSTDAPFVLVLNADVVLAPGCLRVLLAAINAQGRIAGVQPKIFQRDERSGSTRIYSAGQGLTTAASGFERGRGQIDHEEYQSAREVFGVCGAICLLRRELFTELGGYDERFFAFYEDIDLNARARLAGWRFWYVPDAAATHVGHVSWSTHDDARAFNVRLTMRNRAATAIKVLPPRSLPWVMLATIRSLLVSPTRRVGRAAVAGSLEALCWLPELVRERRRLRARGGVGLDTWITKRRFDRIGARG